MIKPMLWAGALALALATPSFAVSPNAGDPAPDLGTFDWVMNEPDVTSLADLQGEVIFIERWGVKCGPCLALIPHVQKLHEEFGDRGLHIFAVEAQGHTPDQIRETIKSRNGKTYPVAKSGAQSYQGPGSIPYGWLIGVDGKVIWNGNPGDGQFDQVLRAEMAKVRFPGLGLLEVDKAAQKAVTKYMKRDLAGARTLAQAIVDDAEATETARADATQIVTRIGLIAERKLAKAQALETERRYLQAQAIYSFLSRSFRKADEGAGAEARLKELRKDKAIKKEIKAAQGLMGLEASLARKNQDKRNAAYAAFAKKFEGTRAAEDAQALIK